MPYFPFADGLHLSLFAVQFDRWKLKKQNKTRQTKTESHITSSTIGETDRRLLKKIIK